MYFQTVFRIFAPYGKPDHRTAPRQRLAAIFVIAGLLACPVCASAQGDDDPAGSATESQAAPTLSDAARDGNVTAVRAMLARGVKINTRFFGQHTALMAAAAYGETEMVRFLLANGADPSLRDAEGDTASARARHNKHTAIADLLDKAVVPKENEAAPAPRPAKVAAPKKQQQQVTGTTKPPTPGKAPSEAFLRQMVTQYYQMGVNGTITAPLRVDVQIQSFTMKPAVRNKVSVVAGRVYRVNDGAPPDAPLYPIIVRLATTEHYNSGTQEKQYHWEFDAFNQKAGMVSAGGWVLSSKGPFRGKN